MEYTASSSAVIKVLYEEEEQSTAGHMGVRLSTLRKGAGGAPASPMKSRLSTRAAAAASHAEAKDQQSSEVETDVEEEKSNRVLLMHLWKEVSQHTYAYIFMHPVSDVENYGVAVKK